MADKEKTLKDRAASALLILPTVYGVVKYRPQVIDLIRQGMGEFTSVLEAYADYHPLLTNLYRNIDRFINTGSGQRAKEVLIKSAMRGESVVQNTLKPKTPFSEDIAVATRIAENITKERQSKFSFKAAQEAESKFITKYNSAFATWTERWYSFSPNLYSFKQVVRRDPLESVTNQRISNYAAFLAYKWEKGLLPEDATVGRPTFDLVQRYAHLFWQEAKKPENTRLVERYTRLMRDFTQDHSLAVDYFMDMIDDLPSSKKKQQLQQNIEGKSLSLDYLSKTGLEQELNQFIRPAAAEYSQLFHTVAQYAGINPSLTERQSKEIADFIFKLKTQLDNIKFELGNALVSLEWNDIPNKETARKLREAAEAVTRLNFEVLLDEQSFGGFSHKRVTVKITGLPEHGAPLEIKIPIQQGILTSRSPETFPVTTPLYVPFGSEGKSNIMDTTTYVVQRLKGRISKILNDIVDSGGRPMRADSLIRRTINDALQYASPFQSIGRNVLSAFSVRFQDLTLATGNGTIGEYRNLYYGVPSLFNLESMGPGNENILVFDLEFTHPDLANEKAVGPQKILSDPRTRIYNINAKVINTSTWREIASLDILIDPQSEEYLDYIRQFYLQKGQSPKQVEAFIDELRGTRPVVGRGRQRALRFSEAIKTLIGFADQYNALRNAAGHNIIGADLPLIRHQFEYLKNSPNPEDRRIYEMLRPHVLRFTNTNPLSGSNKIVDTYFNTAILNMADIDAGGSLEAAFKSFTGLDATAFGEVLRTASDIKGEEDLKKAIDYLSFQYDIPKNRALEMVREIQRMQLTISHSPLTGAHAAGVDVAMAAYLMRMQYNQSRFIRPYNADKYWHLHTIAREVLQYGNTSWKAPFLAMDLYRPLNFGGLGDDERDIVEVSLFSSSQQQAVKLLGSTLQMHHLIPFGLLNNLMRQKYQAFAGQQLATPSEATIKEALEAGFPYKPGDFLTTDIAESIQKLTAAASTRTEGMPSSLTLTTLYTPQNFFLTWEGQAAINEAVSKIGRYFKGSGKLITIELDLPKNWEGLTPEEVLERLRKQGLHRTLQKALERRIRKAKNPTEWQSVNNVDASLSRREAARIFDKYSRLSIEEAMSDPEVRDHLLLADKTEAIWLARGTSNSTPFEYSEPLDSIVMDARINPKTGTITIMIDTIQDLAPGTKVLTDPVRGSKAVIYSSFGGQRQDLNFSAHDVGYIVGANFGKKQELGTMLTVQVGRIVRKLENDPALNSDPNRLTNKAREVLKPLLGNAAKIYAEPIPGTKQYRLRIEVLSAQTARMYDQLTMSNTLKALRSAGITWSYVEEELVKATRNRLPEDVARERFKQTLDKFKTELEGKIQKLHEDLTTAKTLEQIKLIRSKIEYYREVIKNLKEDGPALFDIDILNVGGRLVSMTTFKALSSLRITQDISDYIEKRIDELIETRHGLPLGQSRFRAFFTTMLEENIFRLGDYDNLDTFLSRYLGAAYVNKEGHQPIASSMVAIQETLRILRSGILENEILTIDDLFEKAPWLKDYADANPEFLKELSKLENWRLLNLQDYDTILNQLDPRRRVERIRGVLGTSEFDEQAMIERLAQSGNVDEDVLRAFRGLHEPRVLADDLKDIPIFNPNDRTRINLLQIPSAKTLLKELGYTEQQIEKDPRLKQLTSLNIKLNIQQDIVEELLENAPLSPAEKARFLSKAANLSEITIKNVIPLPGFNEGLALPEFKYFGRPMYIFGQKQETYLELIRSIKEYSDAIKEQAETITAEEATAYLEGIKNNVRKVIRQMVAPSLKQLIQKAQTFYPYGDFKVLGSSHHFYGTLVNILEEGFNSVNKDTFRKVTRLAAIGTELEDKVKMAIELEDDYSLQKMAKELARINKEERVTFAGLGFMEGIMPESEAREVAESFIQRAKQEVEAARQLFNESKISAERFREIQKNATRANILLRRFMEGETYLPDISWREPSFVWGITVFNQNYAYPDEVFELMGYDPKRMRGIRFISPMAIKLASGEQADYDLDLVGRIMMGDTGALTSAYDLSEHQKEVFRTVMQHIDMDSAELTWPIDLRQPVNIGGRTGYKVTSEDILTFKADDIDVGLSLKSTTERFRILTQQNMVIKAYTGVIGGEKIEFISKFLGKQAPAIALQEFVNANPMVRDIVDSAVGVREFTESLEFLYKQYGKKVGVLDRPVDVFGTWLGTATEKVAIKKTKSLDDGFLSFLDEFTEVRRKIFTQPISTKEIDFLLNHPDLVQNNASLKDFFFFTKDEAHRKRLAVSTLKALNTVSRAMSAVGEQMEGKAFQAYKLSISREGAPSVTYLLNELLQTEPTLRTSMMIRRSKIEQALGFGRDINPLYIPDSEIHIGPNAETLTEESTFNRLLGRLLGKESLTQAFNDMLDSFINNPSGRRMFKIGAATAAGLWFFSPNQGVTPVGEGGETYDWPQLSGHDVRIQPISPATMERLLDSAPPTPAMRSVRHNQAIPPPPDTIYHSDLRDRDNYQYYRTARIISMT